MTIRITAQEAAQKYASNLSAATTAIKSGIEAVQTAPGELAAQASDKWFSGISAAHNSGKWKNRVAGVSLQDWKNAILTKGLTRIGPGATAAVPKMVNFYNQLFPHIQSGQQKIASLPSITLDQTINRMVEFIRHMANFRRA